jgi:O-antigen/teichoic acid export membrane protein
MPTVPYFEILALSGLFFPLSAIAYNVLKVQSDGRVIVRLEVLRRVVMTLVLLYTIPRGVAAVAWGMTAMAFVDMLINVVAAGRYTSLRLGGFVMTILPQLLIASAMWLVLYLINPYIEDLHIALRLALSVAIGAAQYLLLSVGFGLRVWSDVLELMHSKSE